ncbi:FGGY family carbohydrate kinase [Humidisolicoccus flavus]|uniref:FGGY family carbohydrate kinase n=1 Tax=Humidisolicoccus flavus TaxID=3111414 RepID=UPI00324D2F7F
MSTPDIPQAAFSALEPVVLSVDAGTGSVRVLAFSTGGDLVAQASREWTHPAVPGHPGGTSFDTAGGWESLCAAFRDVSARLHGREILSIAASSMREGFVLYDAAGTEIWACPNTDGRARVQAEALVAEGIAARIYEIAGDWVSITAPARIRWIAEHQPAVLAQARHLGMLSDWVAYRLSGVFATDPTSGSSSALFDLRARTWSEELADAVGLDRAVLPPVVECGTVLGAVTEAAAVATGLPAGTPIVAGGADTQLALHGIGADSGDTTIVAGTFWQTTAIFDEPVIDPERRLRTLCHVAPDQWMVEGIGFLSGLAMRWFRDGFCEDLVTRAEHGGVSAYSLMEDEAQAVEPGSHGVVAILSNVMQADAWHHAAPSFLNVDIAGTAVGRAAFVRAIEEAAAYVARAHLEILDTLRPAEAEHDSVVFAGGSSSGRLWPQIVADVTHRSVAVSFVAEATSYGAARLAAAGVGVELPPLRPRAAPVLPDTAASEQYELSFARWMSLYQAMVQLTRNEALEPLFTPPGGLPYDSARARSSRISQYSPNTSNISNTKEPSHG